MTTSTLSLPSVFSDYMVLQREKTVPIWGYAKPETALNVYFAGQKKQARADSNGYWRADLDPLEACTEPQKLEIRCRDSEQEVTLHDVLVGDVWFLSGQSNMVFALQKAEECEKVQKEAENNTLLRLNKENKGWQQTSPENVKRFSAVGCWFGIHLQPEIDVPLGIVMRGRGGRAASVFIREEALKTDPVLKEKILDSYRDYKAHPQAYTRENARELPDPEESGKWPGDFWKEVMTGVLPYGVKGVVWYQGESDAWGFCIAELYQQTLELLIQDWRQQFEDPELPFVLIQLPNGPGINSSRPFETTPWVWVQETQQTVARKLPKVSYAVTLDTNEGDMHPKNKRPAGERAAHAAKTLVYEPSHVGQAPELQNMSAEGDQVRLHFDNVGTGLTTTQGNVVGFSLAGQDRAFYWANATIVDKNVIELSTPDVPQPIAARYAFSAKCPWSLINREGIPAGPFRTDDWSWDIPRAEPLKLSVISGTPVVDGFPEDTAWKNAKTAEAFTERHTYRQRQTTSIAMIWDEINLYVYAKCITASEKPAASNTSFSNGEYLEVVVAPHTDGYYYRFACNEQGEVFTARGFAAETFSGPRRLDFVALGRWQDQEWTAPWDVAVKTRPEYWQAELAVPWHSLEIQPAVHQTIGAQITRHDAANEEFTEWALSGRDWNTGAMPAPELNEGFIAFYAPSRFGELRLCDS